MHDSIELTLLSTGLGRSRAPLGGGGVGGICVGYSDCDVIDNDVIMLKPLWICGKIQKIHEKCMQ